MISDVFLQHVKFINFLAVLRRCTVLSFERNPIYSKQIYTYYFNTNAKHSACDNTALSSGVNGPLHPPPWRSEFRMAILSVPLQDRNKCMKCNMARDEKTLSTLNEIYGNFHHSETI